jgi:transcriptional antiterminator RfaH
MPVRRQAESARALFPSYIFCRFPANMLDKVRYTNGVSYILSFGGAPAVVEEAIIETIRERMDPDGVVNEPLTGLERGDRVVIQSGPFQNLEGVFEKEMRGSERVRILLNTVGNVKARVEVQLSDVRLNTRSLQDGNYRAAPATGRCLAEQGIKERIPTQA